MGWGDACVYGWVDGWIHGSLTDSMCVWMDGCKWMGGRMHVCTPIAHVKHFCAQVFWTYGLTHVPHVAWHVMWHMYGMCVWHMPTRFVTDAWQRQMYIDAWVDERMELHGWRTTHGASAAVHGCAHIFMYCMVAALIPGTPDPARQIRCIIGNYTTIVRRRSQVDTQPAKIMRGPWTELTILWALDERAETWDSSVGLSKIGKCFG